MKEGFWVVDIVITAFSLENGRIYILSVVVKPSVLEGKYPRW